MRQPRIVGEREVEFVERPDPEPVEDWVRVRVAVAPLCTEYEQWLDGTPGLVRGHEAAGVVERVAGACDVASGDRVVAMPGTACGRCERCRNGDVLRCLDPPAFAAATGQADGEGDGTAAGGDVSGDATLAPALLKQDWLLVDVPDGLDLLGASMACCGLGPTYNACERLAVDGHDTVLVSGAGPVGLGGVINATHRGARVLVTEPATYRADLAREIGADAVLDPTDGDPVARLRELTDGRGVDAAIECTGLAAARRTALEALRPRGTLAIVGEGGAFEVHGSDDLIRTGRSIVGVWHYPLGQAGDVLRVAAAERGRLDTMITHEFSLSEIERAFELQAARETGKVVVRPGVDGG